MRQFWIGLVATLFPVALVLAAMDSTPLAAQDANYDESKVPQFTLPEPLVFDDGLAVKSKEDWANRRPEILNHFKASVYGSMPKAAGKDSRPEFEMGREFLLDLEVEPGKAQTMAARVREVALVLGIHPQTNEPIKLSLLVVLPAEAKSAVPVVLGYNFAGNHTVHASPEITLGMVWSGEGKSEIADEAMRGKKASRWPLGLAVSRGYGVVTAYYGDVDPDFDDGFKNGVHVLYPELQDRPDNWTSIGAWAWGLSRVMDYFEVSGKIDAKRVVLLGHSRLGKTSLWAGATDERFGVVISNNSGCGGAALARREFGETVKRINTVFPHWFCEKHKSFNDSVNDLPVDQHMLIALMAPRAVYIASAEGDRWADPRGEFLSGFHASPVFRLLGGKGMGIDRPELPDLHKPIGEGVGYHIRGGRHDVKRYDWEQFLDFAQRSFER